MTRPFVLIALALCTAALAAVPAEYDASLSPERQETALNPKYLPPPPTDDSMWVTIDSVLIGAPLRSFWRGLCLDPNGIHVWMCAGDASPCLLVKRNRLTGALVDTFRLTSGMPYDVVRFGDSICVAMFSPPRWTSTTPSATSPVQ